MNKLLIGLLATLATLHVYAMDPEICSLATDTLPYTDIMEYGNNLPREVVTRIGNNDIYKDLVPFILNKLALSKPTTFQGHTSRVYSAQFNAAGDKIVTASSGKTAKIWDANTNQCLYTLHGHIYWVRSAQFNAAGDKIVTASSDKTAKIWDTNTGQCLYTLHGHTSWVRSAQFNTAGDKIVTASLDKTAKIWDTNTGQCLHTLQGHTHRILSAQFNETGDKIITASYGETAKKWDIEQLLFLENYIYNQLTFNQLVVLYKLYKITIQYNGDALTNAHNIPISDLNKHPKLKDAYNTLIPDVKSIFDKYVTQSTKEDFNNSC